MEHPTPALSEVIRQQRQILSGQTTLRRSTRGSLDIEMLPAHAARCPFSSRPLPGLCSDQMKGTLCLAALATCSGVAKLETFSYVKAGWSRLLHGPTPVMLGRISRHRQGLQLQFREVPRASDS